MKSIMLTLALTLSTALPATAQSPRPSMDEVAINNMIAAFNIKPAGVTIVQITAHALRCDSCAVLDKYMKRAKKDFPNMRFSRVSVSKHRYAVAKLGITKVPTVIVFINGRPAYSVLGAPPTYNGVKKFLEKVNRNIKSAQVQ